MALCFKCKVPCPLIPTCPEHAEEYIALMDAYDAVECSCAHRRARHVAGEFECEDCECLEFKPDSETA